MNTSEPDQAAGQLEQPEVVAGLLVVTHQDGAALREPRVCALLHPTLGFSPSRLARFVILSTSMVMSFSKMPASFQRWNQSCTVHLGPKQRGSWPHWHPERNRKMMPLRMRRQSSGGHPVRFGGQISNKIGSMRSQNAWGTSQMVSSLAGPPLVCEPSVAKLQGCEF